MPHLTVGHGLLGQVVVEDDGVLAVVAEVLSDGRSRVGRKELMRYNTKLFRIVFVFPVNLAAWSLFTRFNERERQIQKQDQRGTAG